MRKETGEKLQWTFYKNFEIFSTAELIGIIPGTHINKVRKLERKTEMQKNNPNIRGLHLEAKISYRFDFPNYDFSKICPLETFWATLLEFIFLIPPEFHGDCFSPYSPSEELHPSAFNQRLRILPLPDRYDKMKECSGATAIQHINLNIPSVLHWKAVPEIVEQG